MHTLEYLNALFARRLELSASEKLAEDFRSLIRVAQGHDPANETDEIRALHKEWFDRYDSVMRKPQD